jgi:hypothetical protein
MGRSRQKIKRTKVPGHVRDAGRNCVGVCLTFWPYCDDPPINELAVANANCGVTVSDAMKRVRCGAAQTSSIGRGRPSPSGRLTDAPLLMPDFVARASSRRS